MSECVDPRELRRALEELYSLQAEEELKGTNFRPDSTTEDRDDCWVCEAEDAHLANQERPGEVGGRWGSLAPLEMSSLVPSFPGSPRGGTHASWSPFRSWDELETSCAELDSSDEGGQILGLDLTFLLESTGHRHCISSGMVLVEPGRASTWSTSTGLVDTC